jgi:hypothetical protein
MREPTKDVQLAIARAVLEEWTQAASALRLRAEVGIMVGDKQRATRAQEELELAIKYVEAFEKRVVELEKEAAAEHPVVRFPTGPSKPS